MWNNQKKNYEKLYILDEKFILIKIIWFDGKEIKLILLASCQIIGKYIIGISFM